MNEKYFRCSYRPLAVAILAYALVTSCGIQATQPEAQATQPEAQETITQSGPLLDYYIEPFSFGVASYSFGGGSVADDTAVIKEKGKSYVNTASRILGANGLTPVDDETADLVIEIRNDGRVITGRSGSVVEEGDWKIVVSKPKNMVRYSIHDEADIEEAIQKILAKHP